MEILTMDPKDLDIILKTVESKIIGKDTGILTEINKLIDAKDDSAKRTAIFALTGTVISLIIGIISSVINPSSEQVMNAAVPPKNQPKLIEEKTD
jgi:hypothetical protein